MTAQARRLRRGGRRARSAPSRARRCCRRRPAVAAGRGGESRGTRREDRGRRGSQEARRARLGRSAVLRHRPLRLLRSSARTASRSCPHVSSMQLAFARVKESWEEAFLANLAGPVDRAGGRQDPHERDGGPVHERAMAAGGRGPGPARRGHRLLPGLCLRKSRLARRAGDAGQPRRDRQGFVRPAQRDDPRAQGPRRPTRRGRSGTRLFGNPDECFLQSRPKRGLLTPAEVRSLALAELALRTDERRVGRRRRQRLGGPRGGPDRPRRPRATRSRWIPTTIG